MTILMTLTSDEGKTVDVDVDPSELDLDDPADVGRLVSVVMDALAQFGDGDGDGDICALCERPFLPGEETDEGEYGVCHKNCPDFGRDGGVE